MRLEHAAVTLKRLQVYVDMGQPAPPALVADAIEHLSRQVTAQDRKRKRDRLIRRAALYLEGTPRAKAAALLLEAAALARRRPAAVHERTPLEAGTVRECLQAAALFDKLPRSLRHFQRVLADDRTS